MNSRRLCRWLALSFLCLGAIGTCSATAGESAGDLRASGQKYLATLTSEQKAKGVLPYDTPQRVGWHFIPKEHRKGLQIKDMNSEQRAAALLLLRDALSQLGYDKTAKIMSLEAILRELEKSRRGGAVRDPERYYFTVFGNPTAHGRWGLSVEGHHVSLNFVAEGPRLVASTPTFLGSNPTVVQHDVAGAPPKGTRVLAREESLAFELLQLLDADQRRVAIQSDKSPRDVRNPESAQSPPYAAEGLCFAKMTKDQQQKLWELIAEYAKNMPEAEEHRRLHEIEQAGYDRVYFCWAGADRPGVGHSYRVQGPTFLIEFVNNQPDAAGNPASHIHSVWRDPRGDFALSAAHRH